MWIELGSPLTQIPPDIDTLASHPIFRLKKAVELQVVLFFLLDRMKKAIKNYDNKSNRLPSSASTTGNDLDLQIYLRTL